MWHFSEVTNEVSDFRLREECVAKLFAALRERNYRIRPNSTLNRCCAPAVVLESILLNLVGKIVLQHIREQSRLNAIVARIAALPILLKNDFDEGLRATLIQD